MPSRQVVVDDTDSQIQYTGAGWFLDSGSQDDIGNFGPTYRHTSHGTKLNGSFSFPFQGTKVTVLGTNNIKNTSGVYNPTWECFIDNVSIGNNPFRFPENNWGLCSTAGLEDGPHQLTVNVTTTGQTFWLDSIWYLPSPSLPPNQGAVLLIDHTDSEINYDSEWSALGNSANMTRTLGSTMSFNFTGTGLSWISFIPTELPHIPSQGIYSIDGGPQVSFLLNGLPNGSRTTRYNQEFFSTPELSEGPHTLRVIYQGSISQTPLTLDYLYITTSNASESTTTTHGVNTNPSTSVSVSTNASQPRVTHPLSANGRSVQVGAIVGGVIGGVVLVIICSFLLWWYRRRRRYSARRDPAVIWSPGSKVEPTMDGHEARAGEGINPSSGIAGFKRMYINSQSPKLTAQHTASRRPSSGTALSGYGSDTVIQTRALRKYHEAIAPV